MNLRNATPQDAAALADIYNHYVRNTVVTFEETAATAAEMAQRLAETTAADCPWLIAEEAAGGRLTGFAYASPWKSRCAYRYSRETTVYLAPDTTGRGLGTTLYQALIAQLKQQPLHSLLGGIALPNPASIALHEKLGFHKVAHFEQVGYKQERWVDVGYWQLLL